jgi:hypothetical protein
MATAGLFHVERSTTAEPRAARGPGKRKPTPRSPGLFDCRQFNGRKPFTGSGHPRVRRRAISGGITTARYWSDRASEMTSDAPQGRYRCLDRGDQSVSVRSVEAIGWRGFDCSGQQLHRCSQVLRHHRRIERDREQAAQARWQTAASDLDWTAGWEVPQRDCRDSLVLSLAARPCDMRRGELCGLRWDDIDLDAGVVSVERSTTQLGQQRVTTTPKNHERRKITIDQQTIACCVPGARSRPRSGLPGGRRSGPGGFDLRVGGRLAGTLGLHLQGVQEGSGGVRLRASTVGAPRGAQLPRNDAFARWSARPHRGEEARPLGPERHFERVRRRNPGRRRSRG